MTCDFVEQLTKLRKSSDEAVDHTDSFDDFKSYMHVESAIERDLRNLLRELNKSQHKRLVLLCGSAGDGKSHLLSYLKNSDNENLLKDYEIYNDSTISDAPTRYAIDTLAKQLEDYNDVHYNNDNGNKQIIAINLGVLSNFIESEYGEQFSELKKYVLNNNIFGGFSEGSTSGVSEVFQHINFSDYQMFSLCEDGFRTEYLEGIFRKIFNKQEDNPFYKAYKSGDNCSLCKKCPVRHNYEFVMNENIQKAIIEKIVEIIIKDKAIVSSREVLNLIYDILVHPEFSYGDFCTKDTTYLTDYIRYTTPMLIYDYEEISWVIDCIKKYDFLKERKMDMDLATTHFYILDNVEKSISDAIGDTPYENLKNGTQLIEWVNTKPEIKKLAYRFFVRLIELKGNYKDRLETERLNEYLKCLYYQNSFNEKNNTIRKLYDDTQKALMKWSGYFEEDFICIDDTNEMYWVLAKLDVKPVGNKSMQDLSEELEKFSTLLNLKFKNNNGDPAERVNVSLDYAGYNIICEMRDGYYPSVQDKNRYANIEGAIRQLIEFSSKDSKIILVPKIDGEKKYKMIFDDEGFGLEFKVIEQ